MQWLRKQHAPCPWNAETTLLASQHCHLGVLSWSISRDCPMSPVPCVIAAAEAGHHYVAAWILENAPGAVDVAHEACVQVAANGCPSALQVMCSICPAWTGGRSIWEAAASAGLLGILPWLAKENPYQCLHRPAALAAAAKMGHLPVIRWICSDLHGCHNVTEAVLLTSEHKHYAAMNWLLCEALPSLQRPHMVHQAFDLGSLPLLQALQSVRPRRDVSGFVRNAW